MQEILLGAVFALTTVNTALLLFPVLSKAGMEKRERRAEEALKQAAEETPDDEESRKMEEGMRNILSYSVPNYSRKGGNL